LRRTKRSQEEGRIQRRVKMNTKRGTIMKRRITREKIKVKLKKACEEEDERNRKTETENNLITL
jgi:hypothetical protein